MKHLKFVTLAILFFLVVLLFASCSAIAGIFKAGVWTGIIIIFLVIALIVFIISRARK